MKSKDIKVSEFDNFHSPKNEISILKSFEKIKTGFYKKLIDPIRRAKLKGEKELYSKLKNKLPSFTPSATFVNARKKESISKYSKVISLDFDGFKKSELEAVIPIINQDNHTFCSFISPSGYGLKVFVKVDSDMLNHSDAFFQVSNYYQKITGFFVDAKCKDIMRLCFYSSDKNLYLNKNSKFFQVNEVQKIIIEKVKQDKISEGGRNNHLTEVCGRMNRNGLSYEAIKSALITENTQVCTPPLSESEVVSICKSISKYDSDDPILPKFDQEQPIEDDFYNLLSKNVMTEFIDKISPNSEASKMALAFTFLSFFGNIIGKKVYYRVEGDKHYGNLFVCLVGKTSTGRKGTSLGQVKYFFNLVDTVWFNTNIKGGLYNGIGLIFAVRDEKRGYDKKKKCEVIIDKGVKDKRLLALQTEFVTVLNLSKGDSNTISQVLRNAWDGGNLTTLIKNNRDIATNPHISIVGHITPYELKNSISKSDLSNGFANRFIWAYVEMTQVLPFSKSLKDSEFLPIVKKVQEVISWVENLTKFQIVWDEDAKDTWESAYSDLVKDFDGVLGTVTSRAAPQVIRLAILNAIMDRSIKIKKQHLESALVLWKYSLKSADFIFGNKMDGKVQNTILVNLEINAEGLTKTKIHKLFNNHSSKSVIDSTLSYLLQIGKITKTIIPTKGKSKTVYQIC